MNIAKIVIEIVKKILDLNPIDDIRIDMRYLIKFEMFDLGKDRDFVQILLKERQKKCS